MRATCKYGPVSKKLSTLKTNLYTSSKVTTGRMMFDDT